MALLTAWRASKLTLPRISFWAGVVCAVVVLALTLEAVFRVLLGESLTMTIPVKEFWPALYPSVEITDGPTAEITAGGFTQAEVTIVGLEIGVKLWLVAAHLLQGATIVIIAVVVALLGSRLIRSDPFRPAVTSAVQVAAIAITVGGLAWQVCFGVAGLLASDQALKVTGWNMGDDDVRGDDLRDIGWPLPGGDVLVEIWPVWIGLALFAVAAAFRYGERLQRDTEGMV